MFRTAPELIYLGLGLLIAVFVTAQYALQPHPADPPVPA